MTETGTGKFKILSAAWLGMGGLFLTYALPNLFSLAQGNAPSAGAVSEGYWFYLVGALVMGAIGMANGLALLRRSPVTRPLLAVSSLVLLIPSVVFVVPLLFVVPSLWLALSGQGKLAFEIYRGRLNG